MLRALSGAQSLSLNPIDSGNVVVVTVSDKKHFPTDVISCASARLFPGVAKRNAILIYCMFLSVCCFGRCLLYYRKIFFAGDLQALLFLKAPSIKSLAKYMHCTDFERVLRLCCLRVLGVVITI